MWAKPPPGRLARCRRAHEHDAGTDTWKSRSDTTAFLPFGATVLAIAMGEEAINNAHSTCTQLRFDAVVAEPLAHHAEAPLLSHAKPRRLATKRERSPTERSRA